MPTLRYSCCGRALGTWTVYNNKGLIIKQDHAHLQTTPTYLMRAPLRYQHDTSDLLHLGVVWRTHPVQVPGNLERGRGNNELIKKTTIIHVYKQYIKHEWEGVWQ